jgi:hypothetical protein
LVQRKSWANNKSAKRAIYIVREMTANASEKLQRKPHLSVLALIFFILSFAVARTFSSFFPHTVLISGGLHIHHFWYGIILLAAGGWLGISYNNKTVDRVAAILYGVGGGLIGDEVGLLLTFQSYTTNLTYTIVIVLIAVVSTLILVNRYRHIIISELGEFVSSQASFYLAVFLLAVSIAFTTETSNLLVTEVSGGLTVLACFVILAYFVMRLRKRKKMLNATV